MVHVLDPRPGDEGTVPALEVPKWWPLRQRAQLLDAAAKRASHADLLGPGSERGGPIEWSFTSAVLGDAVKGNVPNWKAESGDRKTKKGDRFKAKFFRTDVFAGPCIFNGRRLHVSRKDDLGAGGVDKAEDETSRWNSCGKLPRAPRW